MYRGGMELDASAGLAVVHPERYIHTLDFLQMVGFGEGRWEQWLFIEQSHENLAFSIFDSRNKPGSVLLVRDMICDVVNAGGFIQSGLGSVLMI